MKFICTYVICGMMLSLASAAAIHTDTSAGRFAIAAMAESQ